MFYEHEFRLELGAERAERALAERASVDLLTWNVFASLDTHADRDWLAYRLQAFGGATVRAPVRISLFSGRDREPLLAPSHAYVASVRAKARSVGGTDDSVTALVAPVEADVRIESPDVLVLVDAMLVSFARGAGGRDRIVELVDAGLEHARRLSKTLAVGVVYPSGTALAGEVSARMRALRDPGALAAEMRHREHVPDVLLREVTWQQLLRTWESERAYLDLAGQPVRPFLDYCRQLGLR